MKDVGMHLIHQDICDYTKIHMQNAFLIRIIILKYIVLVQGQFSMKITPIFIVRLCRTLKY